jgi:hypothetical protein
MIPVYKITIDEKGNESKRAMTLPESTWKRIVASGGTISERFELREIKDEIKETVIINRTAAELKEIANEDAAERFAALEPFTAESVEEKTEDLKGEIEKTIFEMDITELKALAKDRKIKGAHLIKTREKLIEALSK